MKKRLISYGITTLIGLSFVLLIVLSKNIFQKENAKDVFHILVDAFFVPGIIIASFGLLVIAANGGTFDMFTYGVRRFFDLFRSDLGKRMQETFYDYREAKRENPRPAGYLLLVGLVFIAISMMFLIFYYNV